MLDESGITTPDTPKRRIQFTAQARRAHVQHYLDSGQTMSTYCEQHNIPLSTFSAWASKYSRKKAFGFIPVQIQSKRTQTKDKALPPQAAQQHREQRLEIYRKDLKVVLSNVCDLDTAINLLKVMLSCD